jgi:hypothetical protein
MAVTNETNCGSFRKESIMEKRILLLGVVLVTVSFCSSTAMALDYMGAPAAGLKKGQFSAGVDYAHSEMDLKLNEGNFTVGGTLLSFKSKFRMNKVYANIGYGICDKLEAFLRLGGADASFKNNNGATLNGDTDFAIGFGVKTTFYEKPKLKLGGLFQASWSRTDASATINYNAYATSHMWSDVANVELMEIQIAVGPTYELTDKVAIYGGPFFHLVDGDIHGKWHSLVNGAYAGDEYFDIDETSTFGAYMGTQVDVAKNIAFSIEFQHTAAAQALGMSLIWRR